MLSALLLLLMDMGGSSSIDGRDVVVGAARTAYGWSLLLSGAGLMALAGGVGVLPLPGGCRVLVAGGGDASVEREPQQSR